MRAKGLRPDGRRAGGSPSLSPNISQRRAGDAFVSRGLSRFVASLVRRIESSGSFFCLSPQVLSSIFFPSFSASIDNVEIVPYDTPISDVLQFFSLVKLNQDPENVSRYTIQAYIMSR